MNDNISIRNNQDFFKDNMGIVYALGGCTPATFVPERHTQFTPLRINMLKFIFNKLNFREIVCYSQKTIARTLGCSRKAVNEAFMFFREIKIIDFVSGKKKWTMNEYTLGEVLLNPYVRWALRFAFTNLTRAYFKMVERLNPVTESTIVEPEVTQLTNVNILESNTSYCSYRKRKYCKTTCYKKHKEDRLYSLPYLSRKEWINMRIAMWNDWTLTEEKYIRDLMTHKEYLQFYKDSEFSEQDIQIKIHKQLHQQNWNKRRYKNDMASYQNYIGMTKDKKPFEIEKDRMDREFKSEIYRKIEPVKQVIEDIEAVTQKIEEAKKKEPNNFWLQKFKMPGL